MKKTDLKYLSRSASIVKPESKKPIRRMSSVQRLADGQSVHTVSMSLVQSSTPQATSLGLKNETSLRDEIRAIHDMILHPKDCYDRLRKKELFEDNDIVDHTKDADYLFDNSTLHAVCTTLTFSILDLSSSRRYFHEILFLCILSKMNASIFEDNAGAYELYNEVYSKMLIKLNEIIKYKFDVVQKIFTLRQRVSFYEIHLEIIQGGWSLTGKCLVNLGLSYDFKCLNNKSLLDWIRIGELDELMASTTIRTYVNELSCGSFLPKELTWSITNWRLWLSLCSFGFLAPALLNTQTNKPDEEESEITNQSNNKVASRPGCCKNRKSVEPVDKQTSDSGLERKHSQLYVIEYYEYESDEKNKEKIKTNNSGHKNIQIRWGNFWKDIFSIDLDHGQEEGDIAHTQDPQDEIPEEKDQESNDPKSSKKSRVWTPNWLSEYMLFITTPKIVSAFLGISLS